ncbi:MAG TPA: antibiotic biosynthesis monooxygenase [Gemmatimonadaceae bacterium]
MTITSIATFTMRAGREADALALIRAVKRQAEREQPGTLVYLVHLVHLVLDKKGKPTRTLYFYERYRNESALKAHLASTSWQRVVAKWTECFEGKSPKTGIDFFGVKRIAAFERAGAIPTAPS